MVGVASRWGHVTVSLLHCPPVLTGILNLNKPSGMTSRQAVDCVKRLARPAKCGHAGTLDPLASGVLVICVGAATRLIQYVQRMPKTYLATFLFGCSSPTEDIDGPVTQIEHGAKPSAEEVAAVLPRFVGTIEQRPPNFSAVKIAGRRAYALARRGREFELAARSVSVYQLTLISYAFPRLELAVECGSGTYVRSLGRDLAAALGTFAVMSSLVRTAIGGYRLDDAVSTDELDPGVLEARLMSPLTAVADMPRLHLTAAQAADIRHGRPVAAADNDPSGGKAGGELAALDPHGRLTAIVRRKPDQLCWPVLGFHS